MKSKKTILAIVSVIALLILSNMWFYDAGTYAGKKEAERVLTPMHSDSIKGLSDNIEFYKKKYEETVNDYNKLVNDYNALSKSTVSTRQPVSCTSTNNGFSTYTNCF